jgi:hypothetical protein
MLGSPVLDAAIGSMCVFLTLSLIASVIQDVLSTLVSSCPENLFRGIRRLCLGNVDRLEKFCSSGYGMIAGLYKSPLCDFGGKDAKCFSRIGNWPQIVLACQASVAEGPVFKFP